MKKNYISILILSAAAFLFSILSGNFDHTSMAVFGFIGLVLIYAPAVWSIISDTRRTPLQ